MVHAPQGTGTGPDHPEAPSLHRTQASVPAPVRLHLERSWDHTGIPSSPRLEAERSGRRTLAKITGSLLQVG